MEWTYLGHAGWLVEVASLRLLFDPILVEPHHAGVFEVWPPRRVDVDALRPDFLFVSHGHPDHFDPASLRELALRDPDTVVVTSDPLVSRAGGRLGFRTVREVPAGQRIELDGATVITTPSASADPEWGAVVVAPEGSVWNQVDTVLRDAKTVRSVVGAFGLERPLDLALVRWQPMLEIAVLLGQATSFPFDDYADLVAEVAAVEAAAIVPSAAGERHAGSSAWMNQFVFPVSEERFLRDIARAAPATRALPGVVGGRYLVDGGASLAGGRSPIVEIEASAGDPRIFHPMAVPAVSDPDARGRRPGELRPIVSAWVEADLAAALERAYPSFGVEEPVRFAVEVVFDDGAEGWTIVVERDAARVVRRATSDWDALNVVAGSLLVDVIEGRISWADVLLSGNYRAHLRAYEPRPGGLRRADIGATFLYYALSFEESVRRAVDRRIEELVSRR